MKLEGIHHITAITAGLPSRSQKRERYSSAPAKWSSEIAAHIQRSSPDCFTTRPWT